MSQPAAENDNAPRTPFEVMQDACCDRLRGELEGIEHNERAVKSVFATFIEAVATADASDPGDDLPSPAEQLCMLADFETLLQPFDAGEQGDIRLAAMHLTQKVVYADGVEVATQCAVQQFQACDEALAIFAGEGLLDPLLPINLGMIEVLETAYRDEGFTPLAIRNSALALAEYLQVPAPVTMPQPLLTRLAELANVGAELDMPEPPSRQSLLTGPVVKLSLARNLLPRNPRGGPHG